jgi:hypothetical protein
MDKSVYFNIRGDKIILQTYFKEGHVIYQQEKYCKINHKSNNLFFLLENAN